MKVFISYNHDDKEIVKHLSQILESQEIKYFLDSKDIDHDQSTQQKVEQAFETSTHLLVVISPDSLKSSWLQYEIDFALNRNIRVISLLTQPNIIIPDYIRDLKHCSTFEEFTKSFKIQDANNFSIQCSLQPMHCMNLEKLSPEFKGHYGFRVYKFDDKKPKFEEKPYLELSVKNSGNNDIYIQNAKINFKVSQNRITLGEPIDAIFFQRDHPESKLRPNGTAKFRLLHGRIMEGIVDAFVYNNVENIEISLFDGFFHCVSEEKFLNVKIYFEYYFKDFTWNKEIYGS